jgi:hypothetical protein
MTYVRPNGQGFGNPISAMVGIHPDSPLQDPANDARYMEQAAKLEAGVRGSGVTQPATPADNMSGTDPLPAGQHEWYGVGGAADIKTGRKVPESVLSQAQFNVYHALGHLVGVESHNILRARRGADPVFAGGWVSGGNAVMDHSNVYSNEGEAQRETRARGEDAYFDAKNIVSKDADGNILD